MTQPLIQAEHVAMRFGDVVAVEDVSLTLAPGQVVALVGPSGCGKSSVMRAIAGLETISAGEITVSDAADISFVFQDPALMPWASVMANTALPLRLRGESSALDAARNALARVGLDGRAKAYPAQLSGGMRMRVSIARALVSQPGIMLMDEPFAALDELRRFDLAKLVRDIAKAENMAVLFVTHSVFEACFISDQVLVMTAGPGRIAQGVDVRAPGPRDAGFRESEDFAKACASVSASLRAASAQGARP